jgi:regulator of sigma E protease
MGYLEALALLGLLILIHEAGHLAAGRLAGIPIAEFAVGFGPRLWSWRRGSTEYSLRALPLGGFVLPALADDAELRTFALRRRLAFFLGGPLANLLAAVPLFAALNWAHGRISFQDLAIAPFGQVVRACGQFLSFLPTLVTAPESLSGVVGIVVEGNRLAQTGLMLELAISLSISLAVLNLLPIPVLDGGQIVLSSLEEAFPRLVRFRTALTVTGAFLLAGLMVYANARDIVRYWG